MLELLYATGMRVSELVGMQCTDLDWSRQTARVLGKGARERVVPFGNPAARALHTWIDEGRMRLWGPASGDALFLGARGRSRGRTGGPPGRPRTARARARCP